MLTWYQAKIEVSYYGKKNPTNGAIPYWNTATIDWLIVVSRIRLRKAKYDNSKLCDTSLEKVILIQFIVDLTFS